MKLVVNPQLENLIPSTRLNPYLSFENVQPPPRMQILKIGQPPNQGGGGKSETHFWSYRCFLRNKKFFKGEKIMANFLDSLFTNVKASYE